MFRRLFCEKLAKAHRAEQLQFFGPHTGLAGKAQFDHFLKPLRKAEWVVYAKQPFGGPDAVLAYLSRYTHRVAISNTRLIKAERNTVTFKIKDYRIDSPGRYKTMTLKAHEFIRRFLSHVLPKGFHRIRHYGLLANGNRAANVQKARELIGGPAPPKPEQQTEPIDRSCPCCGGQMIVIETFQPGTTPRHKPQRAPPNHRMGTS